MKSRRRPARGQGKPASRRGPASSWSPIRWTKVDVDRQGVARLEDLKPGTESGHFILHVQNTRGGDLVVISSRQFFAGEFEFFLKLGQISGMKCASGRREAGPSVCTGTNTCMQAAQAESSAFPIRASLQVFPFLHRKLSWRVHLKFSGGSLSGLRPGLPPHIPLTAQPSSL